MSPMVQLHVPTPPTVPAPTRRPVPAALGNAVPAGRVRAQSGGRLWQTSRALAVTFTAVFTVALAACQAKPAETPPANDTASTPPLAGAQAADSASTGGAPGVANTNPVPASTSAGVSQGVHLAPLADTIAQRLVFASLVQDWFVAAARNRKLVVDLGRIDIDLKKDPARLAAFVHAARATSPFKQGMPLSLHGPWGQAEATIGDFEAYSGRIVGTLQSTPLVDSIARVTDPLVVAAHRPGGRAPADSVSAGTSGDGGAAPCDRAVDSAFVARLKVIAREAEDSLRASTDQPLYERLKKSLRARRSMAQGCFGEARGVVVVTLYAGDYEWVRERVLLVGAGAPRKATIRDLRFRAHEVLHALDADGDGIDDLAARAWTPRGGGTAILAFTPGTARFERLAQGFAWER
ncbi:MAG: hypothetical protein U0164_15610 [Gemmatimonadaceae bacterium]